MESLHPLHTYLSPFARPSLAASGRKDVRACGRTGGFADAPPHLATSIRRHAQLCVRTELRP